MDEWCDGNCIHRHGTWVSLGGAGSGASGGVSSTSTSLTDVWRLARGFGHVGAGSVTDGYSCGSEFGQRSRRWGRQFKHVLFALLQEQFLQLPLALH